MKFFIDLILGTLMAIFSLVAFVTFLWGVYELILAETQSPYATVRIDPTIAIGWLLVSLIIGLLVSNMSNEGK